MSTRVKIKGRLAFANLFEAKPVGDGGPRFSCSILFDKDSESYTALKAGIEAEATTRWGAKAPGILKSMYASAAGCLQNGDTKAQYAGFEGLWFCSAGQDEAKGRPDVRNAKGQPCVAGDKGAPYSGCYVVAFVDLWAQDNQYGKKVNASIAAVQFWKDGEAFGGTTRPVDESEFEDLSAEEEDDIA